MKRIKLTVIASSAVFLATVSITLILLISYRWFTSVAVVNQTSVDNVRQNAFPVAVPSETDWPWWRGPLSNGINESANPPTKWGTDESVAWKVDVPGRGHSSPINWNDEVFLTTSDETAGTQSLLCFDLKTGNRRFICKVHNGRFPPSHAKNSQASSTPACDEQHVYTAFAVDDAIWVSAVDRKGKIVWQTEAGPFLSHRGFGASVALHGSNVIVLGESRGSKLDRIRATSFLAALDRRSGRIVWRTRRPEEHSYGSPIVRNVCGREQLLMIGPGEIHSYDPETGQSLWRCDAAPERAANTMAASDELVFASGSHPQSELACIRADGTNDVTNTHVVWTEKKGVSDVPSLLYHDKILYVLSDLGVLTAFKAESGKNLWRKRIGGNFSASPIIAGDYLYVIDEEGTTTVLTLGPDAAEVSQNKLKEPAFATPTPVGSRLLIRTSNSLWCISNE